MPLERIPSAQASQNVRKTRVSIWPDGRIGTGRMGVFASLSPQPSFTFQPDDIFFTMGSCFAREVEKRLLAAGLEAPMTQLELPPGERNSATANDILNKYTPFAMLNEVRWAVTGEMPPDEHLYLLADPENGLYVDPHLHPELKPVPLARLKERRAEVLELTRSILRSRVIVFTMGLVEAWYDVESGLYLNGMPPKVALSAQPERFELHVLSYDDISQALEGLHLLVTQYCRPDAQILITVSPVPFKATFTGRDAMAANTYSKSVLRAAVEAFVRAHDNVDYFPSYEMVTLSDRAAAYWIDNIHVQPDMVARIMNTVFSAYMPDRADEFANAASEAREADKSGPSLWARAQKHIKAKEWVAAIHVLQSAIDSYGADGMGVAPETVHTEFGYAYLNAGRSIEAERELRKGLHGAGLNWFRLGLALSRQKRNDEAIEAFEASAAMTGEANSWWRLGVEYQTVGRLQDARAAFSKAPGNADAAKRLEDLGGAPDVSLIASAPASVSGAEAYADSARLLKAGHFDEAAAALEQAIGAFGETGLGVSAAKVRGELGVAYLRAGHAVRGEAEVRRALALEPDNTRMYHKLGLALSRQNRAEEAVAAFRRAAELSSDPRVDYWRLGIELERVNDLAGAREAYVRAADYDDAADRLKKVEAGLAKA